MATAIEVVRSLIPSGGVRTLFFGLALIAGAHRLPAGTVSLAWNASTSPLVTGYKIYYGTASEVYTTNIDVGDVTNATINGLIDGTNYYFSAKCYDSLGDESTNSAEVSCTLPLALVNQPPTLNPIANLSVNENAGTQTVALSGIASGNTNQNQTLTVTVSSSNPGLIPTPTVSYSSPNANGTLTLAPAPNACGTATVTVTVDNGGASNNVVTQSFTINVNPVNQLPTLNPIASLTVNENAGAQTMAISGIASGNPGQNQTVTVTAVSSNPGLIPTPTVSYTSANTTGTLTLAPATNSFGAATITVMVNNGGASNNIVTQSFAVTVNPVNQPPTINPIAGLTVNENAGTQTIALSGIASGNPGVNQMLTVTAASSNLGLIPTPTVSYTSANTTGTLTLAPATKAFGTATITVTVNNGGASNNLVTQNFTVTVNPVNQPPTLNPIANRTIFENSPKFSIALAGITSGATNENQTLTVTAFSTSGLIKTSVTYTSPDTNGTLALTPAPNAVGVATVTVCVNDGCESNNVVTQCFSVKVIPSMIPVGSISTNTALAAVVAGNTAAFAGTATNTSAVLLCQPISANGQFSLLVSGASGRQCAVQASLDLVHWTWLQTNTSPFIMVDTNAAAFSQRYYRACLLPSATAPQVNLE